ncbi:hypothetical protein KC660_02610 [Candidatus Dojkabacteria bacterium]|uniref:50S ribosomal protein L28 n=1 Tax=Candidatus Dojkabacteria bacterium TaxID=2099670 RepID=A0A955L422_9BACT|nr:hypothetical protein [Candidatus Dojkabacteria bacterium]
MAAVRRKHNVRQSKWRFRATAKPRKLRPNLRKAQVYVDGSVTNLKMCMKCYKRIQQNSAVA